MRYQHYITNYNYILSLRHADYESQDIVLVRYDKNLHFDEKLIGHFDQFHKRMIEQKNDRTMEC